ncbi:hypothetical protein BCL90_0463 [Pedobacter alluvionis]|uniref:Uncharacterized protein n=1 Tax=Pedobacter alluvionis TaxID=475253 RepID=A0A497Y8B9_9SPHI|nr:hypothetical protein BCL90_0463 [Pedobacter alluvionis]
MKRSEMEKSLNYVDGVATFKENDVLVILPIHFVRLFSVTGLIQLRTFVTHI